MNWRHYLVLALLGLLVAGGVAALQSAPGYMDANYYYAGGLQLAEGRGFTEPYLWNYLDDPAGLPHPSHAYWMPLASLLAAAGAALFGPGSWSAARVGFVAVAAAIPPLTAALAWSLTSRRSLALVSGLLAVFSGFYLPLITTSDTFGVYMLLGGLFFLILNRKASIFNSLFLGVLAGLLHLTRADGLLWLLLAWLAVLLLRKTGQSRFSILYSLLSVLAGYLLVMGPWFVRNLSAFGTPLAPGGSKMLWLTSYDQLFSFPADQITFQAWWQSGIVAIFRVRSWALGLNLANALSMQADIFLMPLILIGLWVFRRDLRVQLAVAAWALTLAAMTLAFPYAGARGGFIHSGAALQMVWWALAPAGLERVIEWGRRKRGWDADQAGRIFQPTLVVLAMLLTAAVIGGRVIGEQALRRGAQPVWAHEYAAYSQINHFLGSKGLEKTQVVMVADPPGFYLASGNPAVAVPDGDANTVILVARKYKVDYLILEKGSTPKGLAAVYENPDDFPGLKYLGELEGACVFFIER